MISADLLLSKVTDHWRKIGSRRPHPEAAPSTRFALQEAAEVDDAYMRQDPRWKRNNAKEIDPAMELGDLGYMILTALGQVDLAHAGQAERRDALLAHVFDRLAWALIALERGHVSAARPELIGAVEAWIALCGHVGYNPAELLDRTCAKIDAKFMPAEEIQHRQPEGA